MEQKTKQIVGVTLCLVAFGGLAGALGAVAFPQTITDVVVECQNASVPGPVQVVEKNVTVEVPVVVEKEVNVTHPGFANTIEVMKDQDGIDLFDDLDDEDITTQEIGDRAAFIIDAYNLALDAVKQDGIQELDKEKVGGYKLDEDEIVRFKLENDFDEVEFDNIDFDDQDVDVKVVVDFEEDDDREFEAEFIVKIRDGEVDDVVVDSIVEK